MASERNRKEIILAALEKNANIDVEELVRKMNAPAKLLKEKLLSKLTSGLIVSFIGIGLLATAGIVGYIGGSCPNAIYICKNNTFSLFYDMLTKNFYHIIFLHTY